MQRLAWFGGSFNPVHFGHINMATKLLQLLDFEQLSFLPAARSLGKTTIAAHHRLAMLKRALEPLAHTQRLSIDCRELKRAGLSYTIDTLRELREEHPEAQINFIMGEDALAHLETWKDHQQLIDYCHLLILQRQARPLIDSLQPWVQAHTVTKQDWQKTTHGGIQFCSTGMIDCSSTAVRQAIIQGMDITTLVPHAVHNYIDQEKLYQYQ